MTLNGVPIGDVVVAALLLGLMIYGAVHIANKGLDP
jgi:hypothetical protein